MIAYDLIELCKAAGAIAPLLETKDAGARQIADDLTDILIIATGKFIERENLADKIEPIRKARIARNLEARNRTVATVMERMGPALWEKIHQWPVLSYDNDEAARDFLLKEVPKMLPCGDCKKHYFQYLADHPIPAELTAKNYFEWTVGLHNYVNKIKPKPAPEMSIEDAWVRWAK